MNVDSADIPEWGAGGVQVVGKHAFTVLNSGFSSPMCPLGHALFWGVCLAFFVAGCVQFFSRSS